MFLSIFIAECFSNPFDTIKVRMQTHPKEYSNTIQAFSKVYKEEKLMGLYKNLPHALLRQMILTTYSMTAYKYAKQHFENISVSDKIWLGGFVGITGVFISHPVDMIKTRIQANACRNVPKTFLDFRKGMVWSMSRSFVVASLDIGLYDGVYSWYPNTFFCGVVVGCISTVLSFPFDFFKTRRMIPKEDVECLVKIKDVYRGVAPAIFRRIIWLTTYYSSVKFLDKS